MTEKERKLKEIKEVYKGQLERLGDYFSTLSDDAELLDAYDCNKVYDLNTPIYYIYEDLFYLEDGTQIYPVPCVKKDSPRKITVM